MKFGASISYAFGRDEDDSSYLDGLGDIDGGATANLIFERKMEGFSFDVRYEHQFTGEDTGFQVHLGLGYKLPIGDKIMLKPTLKTTYSSSDYMDEYFSVSESQSSRSGLLVYNTDAGFKSLGFHIAAMYSLNRNWGGQATASYDRLVGDTAESPIVKDADQYLLGLGVSYSF